MPLVAARPEPVLSVDTRIGEWSDRLQDLVDDELEGGGEEPSAGELIAEAAGLLQNAVDRALAERQTGEAAGEAAAEISGLRAKVTELEDARRTDEERHRREVARLMKRMETFETTIRAEVDEVHAALRVEAAEAAEGRSIDGSRRRAGCAGIRHRSRCGSRPVNSSATPLAQREGIASMKSRYGTASHVVEPQKAAAPSAQERLDAQNQARWAAWTTSLNKRLAAFDAFYVAIMGAPDDKGTGPRPAFGADAAGAR